jgi:formate dehydrogenase gamma subunit
METTALAEKLEEPGSQTEDAEEKLLFVRFNETEKIQHMIFMICFIVLAITGFMLKIPADLVQKLGGFGDTIFFYRSLLHRIAGTGMILVAVYHVHYLILARAGRRWLFDMLPRFKDLKDLIHNLLYFINVKKEPPEFDRFSYKQKMEYGALIAGTTLMSLTGLLLWTESSWNKFILDIAALVHGMEAVLACLAIIIWHMYDIHFKFKKSPYDKVWITGVIDEEEIKEEHALHYKKIMADPRLQEIYVRREE